MATTATAAKFVLTLDSTQAGSYGRERDAIRGAIRKLATTPLAHITVTNPAGETCREWNTPTQAGATTMHEAATVTAPAGFDTAPAAHGIQIVPTLPAEDTGLFAEYDDTAETEAEVPAPRKTRTSTDLTAVKPFVLELVERGDEVYDIAATTDDGNPLRLVMTIIGGSDPLATGEVLGSLVWETTARKWRPVLHTASGLLSPERRGRLVAGKAHAVQGLFDLLGTYCR
jgi:hypothetical protein